MPQHAPVKQFVSNTGVRIYRIPCDALPDLSGRVYLVLGAGPPTLVDCGIGHEESVRQILAGVETVRSEFGEPVGLRQIERILVTHGHRDHVGGLAEFAERTGAAVGVHSLDRRVIEAWNERVAIFDAALALFLNQAGVAPSRHAAMAQAFGFTRDRLRTGRVDFTLDDGQELDGLRIVHTPGHSPGHVCIQAGNILLCGDHVLPRTVPQQWPESLAPYTGLGHYLESLEKVRRIEGIDLAMGGHEPPMHDFYRRVDEIRETQLRRLDRVLELIGRSAEDHVGGPCTRPAPTIEQLSRQMYADRKGIYEFLALTDVGSRVEYLEQHGRLALANLDEILHAPEAPFRYRAAPR